MDYTKEVKLLEALQPGDSVIFESGYRESPSIEKVLRVTDKQIILDRYNTPRFWKKNGWEVSSSEYHKACIHPYAGEYIDQYNETRAYYEEQHIRNDARKIIREQNLNELSTSQLERIVAIIQEQNDDN